MTLNLNTIKHDHQGSFLALGAFCTSPIESLYAEACETSLYIRREKLALQYIPKLADSPQNQLTMPYSSLCIKFYENQPNTIKPLGLRIESIIKEANIDIEKVAKISLPQTEP